MRNPFRRHRPAPVAAPVRDPRTHDYATRRVWGHDVVVHHILDGGKQLRTSGWGPMFGPRIQAGDYLYLVTEITHHMDPPDMWAALLTFAPRLAAGPEKTPEKHL